MEDYVHIELLYQKVLDYLLDNAKITEAADDCLLYTSISEFLENVLIFFRENTVLIPDEGEVMGHGKVR